MPKIKPLDTIDRKILHEIQRSGRMPIVELAERINLSKTPCLQRLRRLEKEGYILGYRARLDPQKIKQGHLVYVQVKLKDTTAETLNNFNKAVRATPQIITCHMLSGGYDYLIKIRTKDMAAYGELLGDVLSKLPGIQQTFTFPVIEEVKDTHMLMIEGSEERL